MLIRGATKLSLLLFSAAEEDNDEDGFFLVEPDESLGMLVARVIIQFYSIID